MDNAGLALVELPQGKFRLNRLPLPAEAELESDGVFLTTGKAHSIIFYRQEGLPSPSLHLFSFLGVVIAGRRR